MNPAEKTFIRTDSSDRIKTIIGESKESDDKAHLSLFGRAAQEKKLLSDKGCAARYAYKSENPNVDRRVELLKEQPEREPDSGKNSQRRLSEEQPDKRPVIREIIRQRGCQRSSQIKQNRKDCRRTEGQISKWKTVGRTAKVEKLFQKIKEKIL